jgi:hypothetical protein
VQVNARGEAAAVVTASEVVLTCLRDDYCADVPAASADAFFGL